MKTRLNTYRGENEMSARKFNIELAVENIGPHFDEKKIVFTDEVDSNKAVFFATNGTGKSFVSRTFRLMVPEKQAKLADELLTMGKHSGSLSFSIINDTDTKKLTVDIERGQTPIVVNNTGLIFHVFNSDYVEENIKPKHYTPDDDIEGYILGKIQIDLSAERDQEIQLRKEIKDINDIIDTNIEKAKKELKDQGVQSSTTEFGLIEKGKLRENEIFERIAAFEDIVAQLSKLLKVPEKLNDVPTPALNIDVSIFEGIISLLSTQYPKTEWDEDFVSYLRVNRAFIETGLAMTNKIDKCPFCKQHYGVDALSLISDYKAYLGDKEAEVLRKIEHYSKAVSKIIADLNNVTKTTQSAILATNELAQYFPSLAEIVLENPDVSDIDLQEFDEILESLKLKADHLTKTFPIINSSVTNGQEVITEIENIVKRNEEKIKKINKIKDNSNAERLTLRRNLCKAQYIKYSVLLKQHFIEYNEKNSSLEKLQASIVEKEQQARISKRDKVYETLTFFLNRFFDGKYTIDKETFQIKFLGRNVGEKASSILSDGEKNIVAFCFYLASTHLLLERDDDYNKLFFIIDDPVSSMDFHYVYAVAQSLRDIKEFFHIIAHDRIWVFTHNMEFLSIITRNHIIVRAYIMKQGKIEGLKHQLLMPYESHLKDIIDIANGQQLPLHTTANSIRHVLETVSRFEFPDKSIQKYVAEDSILSQDSCIFTMCQDLSHGGIRNQQPFSSDILIIACKTVVSFMKSKYEGQVNAIPSMKERV